MAKHSITLTVNGKSTSAEVEPRVHLGDFLRHQLNLTGTHIGCEHGVCGACTVLVNGDAVRSCLMLAVQADGAEVVTVEGLAAEDGTLTPLQEAFRKHHALQCGFCTPGFLITLTQLLRDRPDIEEEELRRELSGNLCRCTGYSGIVKAALEVAQAFRTREAAR
ncbi:(2Fe-2S)-binding protein [Rhodoligotrophos defluvii]|uniref:(2Fe-2S)-binding protein n=1 Tax=Rhodoligotrophos defluvii TaxID=2561934 RepID=UPI0010C94AF8|nr:(2Fe-2S)-binding protein [Rhodoligotrophos defluvii]